MKKYFIFFSNAEAFLRFQYICQSLRKSNNNNNIVIADFIGKELNIALLRKNESASTLKQLLQLSSNCDEFLIINFKNKLTIDVDYLDFFEYIKDKNYRYLENKIYSCSQDRLELAIKSLLQDISSEVAIKDLSFEIKIAKEKKEILDYFNSVISYVKLNISNKLIYDALYIIYFINNTHNFETKKIFYSSKKISSIDDALEHYKKSLDTLKNLYQKCIITYPFYEETEIIKENQILLEERLLIEYLTENTSKVTIHDKNSILLSDIAYIYHIENEESESNSFIEAIRFCIEKDIFYFYEGKIYMTKNGEKIYTSILNRELQEYLIKGF